jgi:hypothetical protein
MGGPCNTQGGDMKCMLNFGCKTEGKISEYIYAAGSIILQMDIYEMRCDYVD